MIKKCQFARDSVSLRMRTERRCTWGKGTSAYKKTEKISYLFFASFENLRFVAASLHKKAMQNFSQLKLCHLVITSHKEVLFRSAEDVGAFLNCLALAAYSTRTRIIVDAEMSTHSHIGILSSQPTEFDRSVRIRYSKYFNRKYNRGGRFGDIGCFTAYLSGAAHICTAISYILRNPVHHGISATPFGYPHSSANCIFAKDLGRMPQKGMIGSRREISSFLPRYSEFPDGYVMSPEGVFARESFEEIQLVESLYVTPRSFLYNMNRLSGEEWRRDQERDGTGIEPVTLQSMEVRYSESEVSRMLKAERGHSFMNMGADDFTLCGVVDNDIIRRFGKDSVYELSLLQKRKATEILCHELKASATQASRILAMDYNG